MAYQAISTLADEDPVDETYLNKLADNAAFLYDVMACQNWGCPAQSSETVGDLDNTDHRYYIRHRNHYLRWRAEAASAIDYIRVYYNGHQVDGDESPGASPWSGSVDLTDITAWINYAGAWTTATSYESGGIADKVTNDGDYYECISAHTSDAASEPGVGGSWETYWVQIVTPTIGSFYQAYIDFDLSGSNNWMMVDYIMETEDAG
jgi:hypothetical protein